MAGQKGRSGRKRSPEKLKEIKGTARSDRKGEDMGIVPISILPEPPDYLTNDGVKIYHEVGEKLNQLGILNDFNIEVFGVLICELSSYIKLQRDIKSEGHVLKGITININPKVKVANTCFANIRSMASEFGMTPNGLLRMGHMIKQVKSKDPYQAFKDGD